MKGTYYGINQLSRVQESGFLNGCSMSKMWSTYCWFDRCGNPVGHHSTYEQTTQDSDYIFLARILDWCCLDDFFLAICRRSRSCVTLGLWPTHHWHDLVHRYKDKNLVASQIEGLLLTSRAKHEIFQENFLFRTPFLGNKFCEIYS